MANEINPSGYSLVDERLTNTLPPPISVAPMNPNTDTSDATLLSILKRIGDLQSRPLVPDNPLAQIGAAWQGFAAGVQGKPNPALEQYRQERADALSALTGQAQVAGTLATLQDRQVQRTLDQRRLDLADRKEDAADRQRRTENAYKMATPFLQKEDEASVRFGINLLREAGVTGFNEDMANALLQTGAAKTLPQRLDMTIAALDRGLEPADLSLDTRGIDVNKLRSLTPEDRARLMTPEAQTRLADAADKRVKADLDRMKRDALVRVNEGKGSALDRRIAGIQGPATPDAVVAELMVDMYSGVPLSPDKQKVVKTYMANLEMKGLSGDAQLAMRAATGDANAKKALEMLAPAERNLNDTTVLVRAAEVKAKLKADRAYQPTTQEQAMLIAADEILERKSSKPLPPYLEKRLLSFQTITSNINTVRDIVENKGGTAYLGPMMGRLHGALEYVTNNEDRTALYQALDTIFAEIGPSTFGSQFTEAEQRIIRAMQAERTNPTKNFSTRLAAFDKMIRDKQKFTVGTVRENKYRLTDELATLPEYGAPSDPQTETPAKARARELLLQGKSPADVKRIMESEGFK